jgi:hypothetical protein
MTFTRYAQSRKTGKPNEIIYDHVSIEKKIFWYFNTRKNSPKKHKKKTKKQKIHILTLLNT